MRPVRSIQITAARAAVDARRIDAPARVLIWAVTEGFRDGRDLFVQDAVVLSYDRVVGRLRMRVNRMSPRARRVGVVCLLDDHVSSRELLNLPAKPLEVQVWLGQLGVEGVVGSSRAQLGISIRTELTPATVAPTA